MAENLVTIYEKGGFLLQKYTDRSIKLSGEITREYAEAIKGMGGKYNPNLKDGKGWIFGINKQGIVQQFIDDAVSGKIPKSPSPRSIRGVYNPPSTRQYTPPSNVISTAPPTSTIPLQTVTYTLPRPMTGMNVSVVIDTDTDKETSKYSITGLWETNTIVDKVYIQGNEIQKTLVIVNGEWQVLGEIRRHIVLFSL